MHGCWRQANIGGGRCCSLLSNRGAALAGPGCNAGRSLSLYRITTGRKTNTRFVIARDGARSTPGGRSVGLDDVDASPSNNILLDDAARNFHREVQRGIDEDIVLSKELGFDSVAAMRTALSEEYIEKIRDKLAQRGEELEQEKNMKNTMFRAGKEYYERGMYNDSLTALEQALEAEGPLSPLGGEIQLWLALALQACGREEDCIAVYKNVESTHPLPSMRKQAASLRYIMEAPKLELSPEEKVSIPVLDDIDRNQTKSNRPIRPKIKKIEKRKKTWDEEFWDSYSPPKYLRNRYVVAASIIVSIGLAWYSSVMK